MTEAISLVLIAAGALFAMTAGAFLEERRPSPTGLNPAHGALFTSGIAVVFLIFGWWLA